MRRMVTVEAAGSNGNATSDEDDTVAGKKHLFCYWWWRTEPEFDHHGRPDDRLYPSTVEEVSKLTPRLRMLKEMERLALVSADSLDELRHKLFSYSAGDLWVPTGGVPKEELDIPPVVTMLLVGPKGSGKSSLINLMYSVLGRSGLIPFAHTSSEGRPRTTCLEEHNVVRSKKNGFCVFDSRGFEYDRAAEGIDEVARWVEEGVRHRQPCGSEGDESQEVHGGVGDTTTRYVTRKVNCVVVVLNVWEILKAFKAGDSKPLDAARTLFLSPAVTICGERPMLVLTHGDELTAEERIEGRLRVCESLGVPEATGAYDVACLNEYGLPVDKLDPVTSYALAEAVFRALIVADGSHLPRCSTRESLLLTLWWLMWSLSALFAFLSYYCSKLANRGGHHGKLKRS